MHRTNKPLKKYVAIGCVFIMALTLLLCNCFSTEFTYAANLDTSELKVNEGMENFPEGFFTNIDEYHATTLGAMPCVGESKALVFYISIPEETPIWTKSVAELEKMFFSEDLKRENGTNNVAGDNQVYSDNDSLRSFYYRSSYGKVDITGDVYAYTTQKYRDDYDCNEDVFLEIADFYQDTINWHNYDANNDGYIDSVYLVFRTGLISSGPKGRPCYVTSYLKEVDNLSTCALCVMGEQKFESLCHETCHLFGPADIYESMNISPGGTHANDIMSNGGQGDLPGIIKFVLGWIDDPLFLSGEGSINVSLSTYSTNGQILIIYPKGDRDNNKWMIVEYLTAVSNNLYNGVRIWKADMNLDDFFNIMGSTDGAFGSQASPFHYIEALTPIKELAENGYYYTPYYYGKGESITPYTSPNTDYALTYREVLRLDGFDKYIDESDNSGIFIDIDDTNGEKVDLSIDINNSFVPETVEASIAYMPEIRTQNTSETTCLFSVVRAEEELSISDENPHILDKTNGEVIPIVFETKTDGKELYFYLDKETAKQLDSTHEYVFPATEIIKTIDNKPIWIKNFDGVLPVYISNSSEVNAIAWTLNMLTGEMTIQCDGELRNLGGDFYQAEAYNQNIEASLITKKIIIPETVTAISNEVFHSFRALEELYIGKNVKEIGTNAFNGMSLEEIVVSPENEYFSSVDGILADKNKTEIILYPGRRKTISIPEGITKIGDYAFSQAFTRPEGFMNPTIQTFEIPYGVKTIGNYAFESAGIKQIILPSTVETIGEGALKSVILEGIEVDSSNNSFSSAQGCLFDKDGTTLIQVPGAYDGELSLPETVEHINNGACQNCPYLDEIDLPGSLTDIGNHAFSSCISIRGVQLPEHVRRIGDSCFDNCVGLTSLSIPSSLIDIGTNAFANCTKLTFVSYDGSIEAWSIIGIGTNYEYGNPFESIDIDCKLTKVLGIEATCTEEGKEDYWIDVATNTKYTDPFGKIELDGESAIIPAKGHDWGEWTIVKEATEEEEGLERRVCSRDDSHLEERVIPKLNHVHDLVRTAPVAATCTEAGNIEYWTCSKCHKLYSDKNAENEITEAETIVKAKGHTEEDIPAVAATCTEKGKTAGKKCSVCGEILVAQEEIPALGHDWGEWTVIKEATEEEEGLERRVCSRDDSHVEERAIPKLNHVHELVKTEEVSATCTKAGNIEYWTCSKCGRIYSDENAENELSESETKIKALGHKEVVLEAKVATCTETGLTEGKKCSVCGEILLAQEETAALGHNYQTVSGTAVAATCEAAGKEADKKCSRCDLTITGKTIEALGHDYKTVEGSAVAATCEKAGKEADKTCTRCDSTIKGKTIEALGHDYKTVEGSAIEATCTDAGKEADQRCSRCDSLIVGLTIEALGHDWDEWGVVKEATEDEEGLEQRVCRRDDSHIEERIINKLSHVHKLEKVAASKATCDKNGNIEYWTCSKCGKLFADSNATLEITEEETLIKATGHDWTDGRVTKEPAAGKEGEMTYTCSICGQTYGEPIPALAEEQAEAYEAVDAAEEVTDQAQQKAESIDASSSEQALADADKLVSDTAEEASAAVEAAEAAAQKAAAEYGEGSEASVYAKAKLNQAKQIYAKAMITAAAVKAVAAEAAVQKAENAQSTAAAAAVKPGEEAVKAAQEAEVAAKDYLEKATAAKETADAALEAVVEAGYTEDSEEYKSAAKAVTAAETAKASAETRLAEATAAVTAAEEAKTKEETKEIVDLPKVTISKVVAGKKSATVKWKKLSKKSQNKIYKIQIQYSTDKKFKKYVKTTTAKKTAVSKKISKLKKGKRYYFRIRSYKKTGGRVHVSKWSKVKYVKAK